MNKKLIFRILGALASALIIISVFVPFVSVTNYTTSLWESFELTNSLYLPIMIIVFGVIGVIFFSLNIKTEFAYMSTGAITFFLVVQTVDILNQGVFSTLSVGYYFLIVGALLTGLMAFLMNLKINKENIETINNIEDQPSVLSQIDDLYNNDNTENVITPIQPIQPIQPAIQEIPVQQTVNQSLEQSIIQEQSQQTVNQSLEQSIQPAIPEIPVQQTVNPIMEQFNQVNANFQQISTPIQTEPVSQESMNLQQPIQNNNDISQPNINQAEIVNPVVQQFMNPQSMPTTETNLNKDAVDIFGQPINK